MPMRWDCSESRAESRNVVRRLNLERGVGSTKANSATGVAGVTSDSESFAGGVSQTQELTLAASSPPHVALPHRLDVPTYLPWVGLRG